MSNEDDKKRAEEERSKEMNDGRVYVFGILLGWALAEWERRNERKKASEEDSEK